MNDLTTPEGLYAHMAASSSSDDWNDRAAQVKEANGGYPSFWWATVMASGLHEQLFPTGGISVVNIDKDGNETLQGTYNPVTGRRVQ